MEIHRADPTARRRLLIYAGLALVLAALLRVWLEGRQAWLVEWAAAHADQLIANQVWVLIALVFTFAPLAAFAGYFLSLRARTRRAGRWPPPDARTVRDVPVITGAGARRRADGLLWLALAVLVAALAAPITLWWLLRAALSG